MSRLPISDRRPVVVIGAGIAGLACALELVARGVPTVVLESADAPGGKMARARLQQHAFDAGPTVLTMRWVFEELFAAAGASFVEQVPMRAAAVLARHAWHDGARLDLHADAARSAAEIGRFAGAAEAQRFLNFCSEARDTYRALERDFIRAQRPSVTRLAAGIAARRPSDLLAIRPFETLWRALQRLFADARLQQLFGRYATYCGSSPFEAPATLMLVAHVEQQGVWLVDQGMFRIAEAIEQLASQRGARFHYQARAVQIATDRGGVTGVELASGLVLPAAAVVVTADVAALAQGRLGSAAARAAGKADRLPRSLSAVTWLVTAHAAGFPLMRHNVFFSRDYRAEFDEVLRARRFPSDPTIYVCAQDRGADENSADDGIAPCAAERLFCLVNAAPDGDRAVAGDGVGESEGIDQRLFSALERFGVKVATAGASMCRTTPRDFALRYPGSSGALYGSATHGWRASFERPGSSTPVPGIYLAGGSVHPGPGVPMAALSGRLAAQRILEDR